jgi:hypothetical protein
VTTVQIETFSNRGDIASSDFDIKGILRLSVVNKYLNDIGDVNWLRKTMTITTSPNVQKYDGPNDFGSMIELYPPYLVAGSKKAGEGSLRYIGEDPDLVAVAEVTTLASRPQGYYIAQRQSDSLWKAIKFDVPADAAYVMTGIYRRNVYWADLTSSVDMSQYIPEELQWGLVCGLRAEIFLDRYGQGDPRYQREKDNRDTWVMTAQSKHDLARRNYIVSVS